MSLHIFHRYPIGWNLVIRKDLQGGTFWLKECVICGHFKIKETRPRWFL